MWQDMASNVTKNNMDVCKGTEIEAQINESCPCEISITSTNNDESSPQSPRPNEDAQCQNGFLLSSASGNSSSQTSVVRDIPLWEKSFDSDQNSLWLDKEDSASRSSESCKSLDLPIAQLRAGDLLSLRDKKGSDKKKKTSSWYNMLNPTYKSRSEDFKRLFRELPDSERLIVDYSCALQKDILVHGRLYISQNFLCFYANIFRWETCLTFRCKDMTSITKEKTALVIPNAIQICTLGEKLFFTSFGARDKTYLMLFRIWQNALMDQPMTPQELWQWVHYSYGEDLGLTSDDDDYVAPVDEEYRNGGSLDGSFCNGRDSKMAVDASLDCKEVLGEGTDGQPLSPGGTAAILRSVHRFSNGEEDIEEDEGNVLFEQDDLVTEGITGAELNLARLLPSNDQKEDLSSFPMMIKRIREKSKTRSVPSKTLAPTDLSDTSESDNNDSAVEVPCPCESHDGKEILNVVFPISVDTYYEYAFMESDFFKQFHANRKTTDLTFHPWEVDPTSGLKVRKISGVLAVVNVSIGPKVTHSTETQTMQKCCQPGQLYVIKVDAVSAGIPYADDFYTHHIHCITRVSDNECRLRVHSSVKYKKSVWGFIKSLIEKNAMAAVEEYFNDWEACMHKEASERQPSKGGKARRRRSRATKPDDQRVPTSENAAKSTRTQNTFWKNIAPGSVQGDVSRLGGSSDFLIRVMLITLILLLFLNALLYYKLWALEDKHGKPVVHQSMYVDTEILSKHKSQDDWLRLLHHQEAVHKQEVVKWKDMLTTAVNLLQQTEQALVGLQSSIRQNRPTGGIYDDEL